MTALRYSSLAEANPRPAIDAPAPAKPVEVTAVIVHLTNFAPGCSALPISDQRRNRTFWCRPLPLVVRATLRRLGRGPSAVRVVEHPFSYADFGAVGEIAAAEIPIEVAAGEAHLVGQLAPFGDVPLAAFWDGATAQDLRQILQTLAAEGWSPPPQIVED